jgi:hypothetical protein
LIVEEVKKNSDTGTIPGKITYCRGLQTAEPRLGNSSRFKEGEPSGNVGVCGLVFEIPEEE